MSKKYVCYNICSNIVNTKDIKEYICFYIFYLENKEIMHERCGSLVVSVPVPASKTPIAGSNLMTL